MKISDFYEYRWGKTIKCRKDYENSKDRLDYLRFEYELWAVWIDKFYNGEYGIYKTLNGDAPRYVLEDYMDFCYWKSTYESNYLKRDHVSNHEVRSKYIINILTSIFKKVEQYVLRRQRTADEDDEDPGFNLNFQEMKEKMMADPTYKQKWFKAAYEANDYVRKLLSQKTTQSYNIPSSVMMQSSVPAKSYNTMVSRKRSRSKNKQARKRSQSKNKQARKRSQSKKQPRKRSQRKRSQSKK